jgi:anti-sigma B factor antagonist
MTSHLSFSIGIESANEAATVVAVSGEVEMACAPEFEDALARTMEDKRSGALVVDLTRVSFIDSTGLAALVRTFERHRWAGKDFVLVSDDRRVAIMLEVSRLDQLLTRYATRDEALSAVAQH